jgi:pyrimidine operon attenuation protein/uracil phosphoribosyltransferase
MKKVLCLLLAVVIIFSVGQKVQAADTNTVSQASVNKIKNEMIEKAESMKDYDFSAIKTSTSIDSDVIKVKVKNTSTYDAYSIPVNIALYKNGKNLDTTSYFIQVKAGRTVTIELDFPYADNTIVKPDDCKVYINYIAIY